jgi:hypothetical protein
MKRHIKDWGAFLNESQEPEGLWTIAIDGEPVYASQGEEDAVKRLGQLSGLLASGAYQSPYTKRSDYKPGRSKTLPADIDPASQRRIDGRIMLAQQPQEDIAFDVAEALISRFIEIAKPSEGYMWHMEVDREEWLRLSGLLSNITAKWDLDADVRNEITERAREVARQMASDIAKKTGTRRMPMWARREEARFRQLPSTE